MSIIGKKNVLIRYSLTHFIVLLVIFIDGLYNFLQSIDQIQQGLRYGINAYKGVKDACLGAMTGEPKIILVAIVEVALYDERVTLFTKGHECLDMKLNCRKDFYLSVDPYLFLRKPLKDDEVGDLAVIKFSPFPSGQDKVYAAECEGLILSKFQISY